jgi:hypothetical protein
LPSTQGVPAELTAVPDATNRSTVDLPSGKEIGDPATPAWTMTSEEA